MPFRSALRHLALVSVVIWVAIDWIVPIDDLRAFIDAGFSQDSIVRQFPRYSVFALALGLSFILLLDLGLCLLAWSLSVGINAPHNEAKRAIFYQRRRRALIKSKVISSCVAIVIFGSTILFSRNPGLVLAGAYCAILAALLAQSVGGFVFAVHNIEDVRLEKHYRELDIK